MKRLTLLAALLAGLAVTSAASAVTPIYWTPTKMAAALTALQYPHAGTLRGVCKGATTARHGTYAGFRCVMTSASSDVTVWAKPLVAGRVCGSMVSLRACQPLAAGPLAGDPHVCSGIVSDRCVEPTAEMAARRHAGGSGGLWQGPAFDCTLVGPLKFTCPLGDQTYTVTFTKGVSAWTTTVTP